MHNKESTKVLATSHKNDDIAKDIQDKIKEIKYQYLSYILEKKYQYLIWFK